MEREGSTVAEEITASREQSHNEEDHRKLLELTYNKNTVQYLGGLAEGQTDVQVHRQTCKWINQQMDR